MCRLLAFASRVPVTLTDLLGEAELAEFTALSQKHADGWGFAWAEDQGVQVFRAADPAHESPEFTRVSQEHRTDLGLAHVRWATANLAIQLQNTHPFTDGRIAMAHNGTVRPAQSLDPLVPADLLAALEGTTDSERYVRAVMGAARRMDPAPALAETAATIAATLRYTSVNAMLLTDTELVAVSRYRPEAEAAEEEHEYYHMRYRVTPDAVIVSSSGWGEGWETLDNGEMLVVQRSTLEVEIRRFDVVAAAA
ncbi:MAG TPA: class II glutamine amidotransferase [Amnibacterium sp.]|nr:class II glutamine amidotransferase [Amnibacterium sp.]